MGRPKIYLDGKSQVSKSKKRDYNATAREKAGSKMMYGDIVRDVSPDVLQSRIRDKLSQEIKAKLAAKKAANNEPT
jgi:hypothetical protein